MPRLFVYGTLKRGFSNARELEGASFEGRTSTSNGYALYMVSGYPALVRTERGRVHGELYTVSDEQLLKLDAFEGVPDWYRREIVVLGDGTEAEGYVKRREDVSDGDLMAGDEYFEKGR
jgi:gamma-glutamylaminecyclotransferase